MGRGGRTITRWAIDVGTAHTAVCRWDDALARPELLRLPAICRQPAGTDPMEAPHLIPSATHVVAHPDLWTRLARHRWLARHVSWGREAWIGRAAVERNLAGHHAAFAPSFKVFLGHASTATLARVEGRAVSAREVARHFLRELLAEVHRSTGDRVRDLVLTAPVESFDTYRAELSALLRRQGVDRLRFVDEPVAAALGYGLGIDATRTVLVVDFGAGTLDLALVRLAAREMALGRCEVIAKVGRPLGGDHVDGWLLDDVAREAGVAVDPFWRGLMRDEARRVKEALWHRRREIFLFAHPGGRPAPGAPSEHAVDAERLRRVAAAHGLYDALQACVDELNTAARAQGTSLDDAADVLLVGGSTLLPGVFALFEQRFGRDRVRGWRPFEAVAWGATALAADAWTQADFLVHDYAITTYDAATGAPQHLPVVHRGTRFPTAPDHFRRLFVPTCALGEPERTFKLEISEIGHGAPDERLFGFDAAGQVTALRPGAAGLVVPLNALAPTLGVLDPPHPPGDRQPRLEVCLGVDADRWLIATVRDLKTGRTLLAGAPVVRLL